MTGSGDARRGGGLPLWQSLTGPEASVALRRDPVLVLPLAAVEQHGPHLPLSTDLDIGMGLLERAFEHLDGDVPAWVLPPIAVGASDEHLGFAGMLSRPADELAASIRSLGGSLGGAGVRRLVLANSHGGNRYAMSSAGLALRRAHAMLVVEASWFRFGRPADVGLPDAEWKHGLHGGAVETSMMLHLRPDLVRADQVADFGSLGTELERSMRRLGPESEAGFSWLVADLNRQGAVGDATLASSEMGARLVAWYGDALADVIRDASEFPLDRLAPDVDR